LLHAARLFANEGVEENKCSSDYVRPSKVPRGDRLAAVLMGWTSFQDAFNTPY
jgi:hypothetical protein